MKIFWIIEHAGRTVIPPKQSFLLREIYETDTGESIYQVEVERFTSHSQEEIAEKLIDWLGKARVAG